MTNDPTSHASMPFAVRTWFVVAFALLAVTGLLLGRIVEFVDFSERAPFSLLGIFMMVELALVLFGLTVALQRKRIAHRFALAIAFVRSRQDDSDYQRMGRQRQLHGGPQRRPDRH